MNVSLSAVARELHNLGVTGDALVTALERIEARSQPVRSANAERQARYRERVKEREAAVTNVTDNVTQDAKKEIPHTPLEKTTTQNQPTRAKPKKQATPFPDDFQLSEKNRAVAAERGFTPAQTDVEVERMRNWSKNATGGKGHKKDWQSFAFNWLTDEKKSHGNRNSNSSKLNAAFDAQRARLVEQFGEPEHAGNSGPEF